MSLPIALTPKNTLLIGAGNVAKQKHGILSQSDFNVKIIAKSVTNEYFADKEVEIYDFDRLDFEFLKDKFGEFEIVIDASGDENLGEFLYKNRKNLGILLNVVDKPKFCDFYFGSITKRGDLSVLVSSNGASPILTQIIRDKIAKILPKNLGEFTNFLKFNRKKGEIDKEKIKQICKENLGKVFLIGCGPNSFKSLSIEAYEALNLIDVALIDNLVGIEIWEFLQNRGVECISVAKIKGKHSFSQDEINALMLKYAKDGKIVGRLKGGNPAIFGRVYEEVSFLTQNSIECECISGMSSAFYGLLSSGIIPTIRDISSGVLVVSAHLKECLFDSNWLKIAKEINYTIVVLMAHSFANRILEEAKKEQICLQIPAAFVSKIDTNEQKTIIGTLEKLPQMANLCERPAILVIGNVVGKSPCMPCKGAVVFV